MLNLSWLTVTLLIYLIAVVCALALIISVKWYRPATKLGGPITALIIVSLVIGLASIEMLNNSRSDELPTLTKHEQLYKQVYWLKHENAEFALSQALKLWEQQTDASSKLALGLAYIQADQWNKGIRVLQELSEVKGSEIYLEKNQLASYIKQLEELTVGTAADSDNADSTRSAIQNLTGQLLTQLSDGLSGRMNDQQELTMELLAKLDPDRLQYMYHSSSSASLETVEEQKDEVQKLYKQAVEQLQAVREQRSERVVDSLSMELDDSAQTAELNLGISKAQMNDDQYYLLASELAKTAVYMNDDQVAQSLLVDVIEKYATAAEPSIMLGEMLLNGRTSLTEQQLQALPSYTEAKLDLQKQESKLLSEWSAQVSPGDAEAAQVVEKRLEEIKAQTQIEPHLAYALLSAQNIQEEPQVAFLLSNYYFQTQELDQSSSYIQQLAEDPSSLTVAQQYYFQQLQTLPEGNAMSMDDLQARNEMTTQLYSSFKVLNGQRIQTAELTEVEKGFAVYLSNELISLNRSSLQISTIQAKDSGEVDLYVSARNFKNLTTKNVFIRDNEQNVSPFTIEKMSESTTYERNIVLLVDRSGSMAGERIEGAKLALQNFVGSMNRNERIGLVAFDDAAEIVQNLSSDRAASNQAIAQLEADGGTNISESFDTGLSMLESQAGERIIFILSDGEDPTFSEASVRMDIIERANAAGVTIFAIGFASGYETLRDVADATGGQYIAASGMDALLTSFEDIKATIESSYKISYKLDPMDKGLHRVRITDDSNKSTTKSYVISGEAGESDQSKDKEQADKDENNEFGITGTVPNRITASSTGTTTLKITGIGLEQTDQLLLDRKSMKFTKLSDTEIEMKLSNNQTIGIHELKVIAADQREDVYQLSVTKTGDQEFRWFGDAKVYGDFIEDQSGDSTLKGNTSVDHFIYDSKGSMTLTGGKELAFRGMQLEVDRTKLGIIASLGVSIQNVEERYLPDKVMMTVNDDQKTFVLKRTNAVTAIPDKFTLGKFGLEVNLVPQFTYEAKYNNDDGTLTANAGIKGFSALTALNDRLAEKWTQSLKFMPTDAVLSVAYEKDKIAVNGEVGASLNLGTLLETGTVNLKAGYEHGTAKLDLGLEIEDFSGQFRAFSFDLSRLPVNRFGLQVGWQGSLMPKAGEVLIGSPKGVPLGTTGMTVRMVKVGIDTRDGFGGLVGLDIGSAVDGPAQEVIKLINKVPFFDMNENVCVLCVEGEAAAKSLGTSDWSLNGALALKVIGFEAANGNTYIDVNEIATKISINYLSLEGNNRLLWRDKKYNKDLTMTTKGTLDWKGLDAELVLFVNAIRFKKSYVDIKAESWLYSPHIHIGADAEVYR